jgi:hypothetical protein
MSQDASSEQDSHATQNSKTAQNAQTKSPQWFRERLLGETSDLLASDSDEIYGPDSDFLNTEDAGSEAGDDGEPALPSLRQYLSQRIFESHRNPVELPAKPPEHLFEVKASMSPEAVQEMVSPDRHTVNGNHINSIDTQFTAGLEQFLPTPAIRFRIIKERLATEMTQLVAQIEKYETLLQPPPDIQTKIQSMHLRLSNLKRHDEAIDKELAQLAKVQNAWMYQTTHWSFQVVAGVQQGWQWMTGWIQPRKWAEKWDPKRFQMISLNRRLSTLQEVMQDQMSHSAPSSVEMSTLVNQYDQTLKQLEHLSAHYKNKKSWRERWGDNIMGQLRKLYT